ncbi:MAG: tol-pal system protein YbgF [Nitrospirae bacterium 13_1_20CM_2_62_14]|nr:MAG: tol-pal system protein YbgF [Nitrospirae bacterium 13_1_20CM_2_62_14]
MVTQGGTRAVRVAVTCALGGVLLSGCLAQQADVKQVNQRVSETSAKLRSEITELREADLSRVQGRLDENAHQIAALGSRLDDLDHRAAGQQLMKEQLDRIVARLDTISATVGSVTKSSEMRLEEHQVAIGAGEARTGKLAQQLESQNRALSEQLTQLSQALSDFKNALTGLGEKLVQEGQRVDALTAKVESDASATTTHLNEVNKSVGSVAKALETVAGRVMARVEERDRRLDDMAKSLQAVSSQINALTQTVAQIRESRLGPAKGTKPAGKVEQQRLGQRPEQHTEPAVGSTKSETDRAAPPPQDSVKETYQRTMEKFQQGELDTAMQGFSEFLVRYPTSTLAPNAQYWLGECYYGKKQFEQAIEAFDRVKLAYPASEKVPAALLKKGFAYLALNDRSRAVSTLKQVVNGFPKTPEADKASGKLSQLNQTR